VKVLEKTIERIATDLLALAAQLAQNAERIAKRAHDDLAGLSSPSLERSAPQHADDGTSPGPTPVKALSNKKDPVKEATTSLLTQMRIALTALRQARALAAQLLPLDPAILNMAAKQLKSGAYCVNKDCGRYVEGTRDDRIRSGRCSACFQYRLRTGNDRDTGITKTKPE